jgi:menaquinone-dependent protoporphyrinogen oxidase
MDTILVLYATREGQTRKIAEHVGEWFRTHGQAARVVDVASPPEGFDLTGYRAVVLAASVHAGRHEREMVRFVKAHRAALERMPTAFLSVSLSEAGAEDARRSPEARAKASADVQGMIDVFVADTGLHPASVKPVAGALLYTRYGRIVRFVMKQIARKQGGSTETSSDHEYTDWAALDRFVESLAGDGFRATAPADDA